MQHKAALLALYNRALATADWGDKTQARVKFEQAYNSGLTWPHLYEQLGPVSWKTIESWSVKVRKHGNDCFFLADKRGAHLRGKCGLTEQQTEIFLRCVLRPNRPRISEAYRVAKAVMEQQGIDNTHSEATYRRWLHHWKERNHHLWVFSREGAKAWNDQCAMYIERDMNLLNVGDVIVADGHNLNFEIINPWTGKPQNHMTLILFYDMASNMPLGWEIMPTENTAAISSALRRAVLRLGKYPRVVYLDNGRAFKARFFKGSQNFDEAGYAGLYERMGCQTIYAWPYHGQSKTVERFFGSFAELERLVPGYTGTSIEHKPPRMLRGEKLHRTIHEQQFGSRCLSLEEAHTLIAFWFDEYAKRPQRGHLNGRNPMEVFVEGKGPGVDKTELIWLMMSLEIKTIHRNGITFRGQNYYHPALYGRRHKVSIRYDLQDTSSIWVLDQQGELICEATPVEKVHPAAAQLGNEGDKEKLRQHIALKKNQEKQASASARSLLKDEILPEHRRQMAEIGVLNGEIQTIDTSNCKMISLDAEKLRREVEEATRLQQEAVAKALEEELMRLNDSDRYERLIEMSAQGMELTQEWNDFMTFFEKTDPYRNFPEYWESCRIKYGLMWRKAVSGQ
ncbi:Mu transposase C-terminal domain-containing protein [Desulfobulbus propionicus]|nr:Mu transposase C-terminal domain-containing protein [Desulfobulbus propionicus]